MNHPDNQSHFARILDSAGRLIASTEAAAAAFTTYFDGSAIVDEQGRALLMLHGTRPGNDITSFHIQDDGHDGAYFTPDPHYAGAFTCSLSRSTDGEAGAMYPVYLSIKNPFILVADDDSEEWERFCYRGYSRADLIAQGYDGAVLRHKPTGEIDQVIAFHPWQIKSAIANPGTYNVNSPHITDGYEIKPGYRPVCDQKEQFFDDPDGSEEAPRRGLRP